MQVGRAARKFFLHHEELGRPLKRWDTAWERWIIREAELLGLDKAPPLPIPLHTGDRIGGKVLLKPGDPRHDAWTAWWLRTRRVKPPDHGQDGGWWFDTEWPPDHVAAHPAHTPAGEAAA